MKPLARRTCSLLLYAGLLAPAGAQEEAFPFIYSDPYFYLCDNELTRRIAADLTRFVTATYTPAPDATRQGIVEYQGTGLPPAQKPDDPKVLAAPARTDQSPVPDEPAPKEGKAADTAKEQLENIHKTRGWELPKASNP